MVAVAPVALASPTRFHRHVTMLATVAQACQGPPSPLHSGVTTRRGKARNKQSEDLNHLIAASEILQHRSGDDVLSKLGHHQ